MAENPLPAEQNEVVAPDTPSVENPPLDPEVERARKIEEFQAGLSRETRSTGIWMLVWGGLSLVASGFFNASWGLLLVVIGIASFFIKDVAMLVVYAVIMAWAAVWNILSSYLDGAWTWAIFSLLQVYWAVRIYQGFARFRRAKTELAIDPAKSKPIARILPATGCLLSVVATLGVVVWTILVVVVIGSGSLRLSDNVINLTMNLVLNVAILGFALCLGALLSGYRYKALSIIGMIVCLLLIIGWFILLLLPQTPAGTLT